MILNDVPDSVDTDCEDTVGDGGIAGFNAPERLRETVSGGGGVDDDLGTVECEHIPVLREVTTVANVHTNATELGLEHGLAKVALEVVG